MAKAKTRRVAAAAAVLCAALATVSAAAFRGHGDPCASHHYLFGSRESRENMAALLSLLDAPGSSPEENFAVVREISNAFFREGEYGRLDHFLGGRVAARPDDPFNSHHLLMLAYAHARRGSDAIAARYFELILKNYPDLAVNGASIHLACLLRLAEMESDPERQAWLYLEMIERFPGDIDVMAAWFRLAVAREGAGDWDGAMRAYANFLAERQVRIDTEREANPQAIPNPQVPGIPNAERRAQRLVNLQNSSRNWTFATLPALTAAVRQALDNNSAAQLRGMKSGAEFFTRSWGQEASANLVPFNIGNFMWGTRIRHADRFHERSTADEVFLRTWGWQQSVSVWYFHFRRIHFPADPSVHGRWEWAGIYFGES